MDEEEEAEDNEDNEESTENKASKLRTRGDTRLRRPKTIQQSEVQNEKAKAAVKDKENTAKKNKKKVEKTSQETSIAAVSKQIMPPPSSTIFNPVRHKKYLYKPFVLLPDLTDLILKTVEVRVHKCYLTKFNKAVQNRQFFGSDFYSSDSDVVCILQHQGIINLTD